MALTAEQLEERRTGIGGSDAAAVVGVDPYRTPLEVYLEKVGEAPERKDNAAMYWGRRLEDVVAEEWAKRTGLKVRRRNATLRHPKHPYMLAHVDRVVQGSKAILECKTAGAHMADQWGEPGTDEVPEPYLIQTQHYLAVLGYEVAYVAVLIGGRDFRTYEVPRDRELIEALQEIEGRFWKEHVEPRVPPDPRTIEDIRLRWPRHQPGKVVQADEDVQEAVSALAQVRRDLKALKAREADLVAEIERYMADAEALEGPDGRTLATWKTVTQRRLDTKALREAHPDIARAFERETESRRFLLKLKED